MTFDPSVLEKSYDDLHDLFSVRTSNGLKRDDITTVRELVLRTEKQILALPNIGRKCLKEIKELLSEYGLTLGMTQVDLESMIAGHTST